MLRRFLPLLVVAVLASGRAASAGKPDDLTPDVALAKKDFAAALKAAQTAFNNGTNAAVKSLGKNPPASTRAAAAATYQTVVTTYATSVAKAANAASVAIETAAVAAMTDVNDGALHGAIVGDGGSLDQLADYVELQLQGARKFAVQRMPRFTAALAKGSNHARMNIQLPAWPFERRAAPALNNALTPLGPAVDVITMWVGIATRLDDGSVKVAFAGTAPKTSNGNFGIYLVATGDVKAIGKLSDGGIAVADDRTWTLTATLNNPSLGEAVTPGNRLVEYGVDPFDQGPPAGRQPGRFMVGGVIGIQ